MAIAALPGDFQIYRFTIPILKNGKYKDFPDFGAVKAITTLMELTPIYRKPIWLENRNGCRHGTRLMTVYP
jgi:hypothetical protein